MNDDTARKVIPLLAALVLVGCVVYALLPFKAAGVIECGPPLRGSEARTEEGVGLIRPDEACSDNGRNRLTNAATVGLGAVIGGAAALLAPRLLQRLQRPDEEPAG